MSAISCVTYVSEYLSDTLLLYMKCAVTTIMDLVSATGL